MKNPLYLAESDPKKILRGAHEAAAPSLLDCHPRYDSGFADV